MTLKQINNSFNLNRVARDLNYEIETKLSRIGIMYRPQYRAKSIDSISRKIKEKGYTKTGKRLQDLIGIRITLYFEDDLELVYNILKKSGNYIDETVDSWEDFEFRPIRINLIFRLLNEHKKEVEDTMSLNKDIPIDTTFEVQLRTVLSEGWHEVDHDLRYKCKKDWEGYKDLSRNFNSILATLQLADWSIKKIFDDFSYYHYQNKKWEAMLRHKFRIRFSNGDLSTKIVKLLDNNPEIVKSIFRLDRIDLLSKIYENDLNIPLTMDNLVFIINHYYLEDETLSDLTPLPISKLFN